MDGDGCGLQEQRSEAIKALKFRRGRNVRKFS
jgi:hypothetical protein